VLRILRSLKIVKYVQYLIIFAGQKVFLRSHIAQVTYGPILLTVSTNYVVTFVSVSRHEQSIRRAKPFTFTYRLSICRALLVFGETRPTSKISVTFVAGETNVGERARKARHAIVHVWSQTCYITPTTFMACVTYILFRHCTSKVNYHMMSFDIVVE